MINKFTDVYATQWLSRALQLTEILHRGFPTKGDLHGFFCNPDLILVASALRHHHHSRFREVGDESLLLSSFQIIASLC